MSKQVLDILQIQHLKELGVDTSNASCYILEAEGEEYMYFGKCTDINGIPTFTLQDILDLLPKQIITNDIHNDKVRLALDFFDDSFGYAYYFETCGELSFYKKSCCYDGCLLIDAAYEMLCWCIENGYIETKKK